MVWVRGGTFWSVQGGGNVYIKGRFCVRVMAKEKKKLGNLDDLLNGLREEHSKDLDASFKAHDEFSKDENVNHLYLNVFGAGQDALYQTISAELDKSLRGDGTKVHGKKKEVKQAIAAGIKKYFERTQPSLTEIMRDLKMDEDEQYEYLTSMYDDHIGVGKIKGVESIRSIEKYAGDRKMTVGHIRKHVSDSRSKHAEGALQILSNKYITHHFAKYQPAAIAAYLRPQLEKAGFEVEDKVGYATADLGELLQLRKGLLEKEGHHYLKKKEEKK